MCYGSMLLMYHHTVPIVCLIAAKMTTFRTRAPKLKISGAGANRHHVIIFLYKRKGLAAFMADKS